MNIVDLLTISLKPFLQCMVGKKYYVRKTASNVPKKYHTMWQRTCILLSTLECCAEIYIVHGELGFHPWQEFKFQGVQMRGPMKSLKKTGCNGRWQSNIQRDVLRKVQKDDPYAASCWQIVAIVST